MHCHQNTKATPTTTTTHLYELDRQRQLLHRGSEVLKLVEAHDEWFVRRRAVLRLVQALVQVACPPPKKKTQRKPKHHCWIRARTSLAVTKIASFSGGDGSKQADSAFPDNNRGHTLIERPYSGSAILLENRGNSERQKK